jgi:hypothetical protein
MLVQILRGYNRKNLKTWDGNIIYIQYSCNIGVHTSTSKSPFETLFGYFPPSPLDVAYEQKGGMREDIIGEALRMEKFVENIRQIHLQV